MNEISLKIENLEVESMFTSEDKYFFSRWSSNIVPMVIGLNDFALGIFKKKLLSIWEFSPIQIEEFEIKNKANFVFIFLKKWNELEKLPGIEEIVPDHLSLVKNLSLKVYF